MILLFSECIPDYGTYLSPYQVWGVLEEPDTPSMAFERGFLPGAYDMSHYYLTRSVRVDLRQHRPTGRVRYAARRCAQFAHLMVARANWEYTAAWRRLAVTYLSQRLTEQRFSGQRFAKLLCSPLTTHVLTFTDTVSGQPAGLVTIFLDAPAAYYGVAVYDLSLLKLGIGGHMMATALSHFRQAGFDFAYLGCCYSVGALYKSRFAGMEFFNGYRWSADRTELRFLVEHQQELAGTHLLEFAPYQDTFCRGGLPIGAVNGLRLAGTGGAIDARGAP